MTPGDLFEFAVHRADQLILILFEDGTPIGFGLEVDKVFGVEESGDVGSVVGAARSG